MLTQVEIRWYSRGECGLSDDSSKLSSGMAAGFSLSLEREIQYSIQLRNILQTLLVLFSFICKASVKMDYSETFAKRFCSYSLTK